MADIRDLKMLKILYIYWGNPFVKYMVDIGGHM